LNFNNRNNTINEKIDFGIAMYKKTKVSDDFAQLHYANKDIYNILPQQEGEIIGEAFDFRFFLLLVLLF